MLYKSSLSFDRQTFRQTSYELDQFYRLDFEAVTTAMRARFPRSYSRRIQRNIGLLRHIVQDLSGHYTKAPVRSWLGLSDGQQAVLRDSVYPRYDVNGLMAEIQDNLVHQRTLIVVWIRDSRGITPILLKPYEVEVDPDPIRWWDLQAAREIRCRIPVTGDYYTSLYGELVMTPERIEMTPASVVSPVYDSNGNPSTRTVASSRPGMWSASGQDVRNPFTALNTGLTYPAFVIRADRRPPSGDFFGPVANDLHACQIAAVVDWSALLTVASDQSFGLRWGTGLSKDMAAELELSTDTIAILPEGGSLNNTAPTPAADQYLRALQAFVDVLAITNNMSPADFKKDAAITALAKQVSENDRAVARGIVEPKLRQAEQDLYDTWRTVDAVIDLANGFPGAQLSITWTLPKYPADPQNQAVADRMNIELSLTTAAEILAERKGISLDEARKRVEANRKENAAQATLPDEDKAEPMPNKAQMMRETMSMGEEM